MDMYSSNSLGSIPSLAATPSSYTYSAMHDPLALPDFCDFDGKNDLMDCSLGFTFPELNSFGGLDLDKLDQLVRMEADLERIERLERLEVEVGSLDSDGEVAISFPPTLIGPSLGLSGWAPSDLNMDSSHVCSVAAAMDSDSTDVVVNPLSVLPVSSSSSLNSGWSTLLQRPTSSNQSSVNNVPSTMPASPAVPQGSPISLPQRLMKSVPSNGSTNNQNSSILNNEATSGFPKPAYSYSCLIALALKNSRTGCLPVSEIYRFMCEHFPYFRTAPAGWKNSVRHNLSLNKCFEKVEKVGTINNTSSVGTTPNSSSTRKGCLWTLSPAKATKMDEEVLKWSRKDPLAIKRAMAYPDALELLERGEMKMDSVGGASTESEDEGEGVEEEADGCPSPLTRVTPPEASPPLDDINSKSSSNNKEQLNIGVSIVSRIAPPISGRRPSVQNLHQNQGAKQPKVYYSLPKFQTSGNELIIIGDARLESIEIEGMNMIGVVRST